VTVGDDLPSIAGDREALAEALWNLLDNAVKYSPGSESVQVEVSRQGGWIAIRVRDQGVGIPKSEHKRIFRKFVRGASAGSGQVRGAGIGLSMVEHIVRAHRGKVVLESEAGKGSTFTLLLRSGSDESHPDR
jgi:two-component system, OmpR family, phosphate regulon sensor histidine kinase PhoR